MTHRHYITEAELLSWYFFSTTVCDLRMTLNQELRFSEHMRGCAFSNVLLSSAPDSPNAPFAWNSIRHESYTKCISYKPGFNIVIYGNARPIYAFYPTKMPLSEADLSASVKPVCTLIAQYRRSYCHIQEAPACTSFDL